MAKGAIESSHRRVRFVCPQGLALATRHASIASRNSLPEKKFFNGLALIRAALVPPFIGRPRAVRP